MAELMDLGNKNRTVGATQMNAESSRSHSVCLLTVHQKDASDESRAFRSLFLFRQSARTPRGLSLSLSLSLDAGLCSAFIKDVCGRGLGTYSFHKVSLKTNAGNVYSKLNLVDLAGSERADGVSVS